jgi:hypothetical protein
MTVSAKRVLVAKVLAAAEALHGAHVKALARTKGFARKRSEARAALVNLSIAESSGINAVLPKHVRSSSARSKKTSVRSARRAFLAVPSLSISAGVFARRNNNGHLFRARGVGRR